MDEGIVGIIYGILCRYLMTMSESGKEHVSRKILISPSKY